MKKPILVVACIVVIGALLFPLLLSKKEAINDNKENVNEIQSSTKNTAEKVSQNSNNLIETPNSWKEYSYSNYKISFPSDPHIDRGVDSITYVSLDENVAAYFLSVTQIPPYIETQDVMKILEGTVASSVKNLDAEASGTKLAGAIDTRKLTGLDSIDFVINIPDGPRTYMGRNVIKGNNLYEMRVIYVSSKSAEYRGFVDSLMFQ